MANVNRYVQIIERIFAEFFRPGVRSIQFRRSDIERVAKHLGVDLPKNLGDLVYTFRYRGELPESIRSKAPRGESWIILPAGRGVYRFETTAVATVTPTPSLAETKVPDATPGIIAKYALSDEQALLAKLRYNRLVDIFTGVTCYSLQSHLRTTAPHLGQVETDEVYVGLDKRGAHYVFPVQAKGGRDKINIVQIMQDFTMCKEKFKPLVCRPVTAQFMRGNVIAMFEFEPSKTSFAIVAEKHYRLAPPEELTEDDLRQYQTRPK